MSLDQSHSRFNELSFLLLASVKLSALLQETHPEGGNFDKR